MKTEIKEYISNKWDLRLLRELWIFEKEIKANWFLI